MKVLERLDRWLVAANRAAVAVIFSGMFALVFTNVVTRYGFNFSINWSEELARYGMIWLAFLGAGLALREGRHVAIEALQARLPVAARRVLRTLVALLMAGLMAALLWLGWRYAAFAMTIRTAALQWPAGVIYAAVPVGASLFLLHLAAVARRYVREAPHADDGEGEA